MSFPCDGCGSCCRRVGGIAGLPSNSGRCLFLANNRCLVYEDRPFICRVDDIYDAVFANQMTQQEFYDMTAKACGEIRI